MLDMCTIRMMNYGHYVEAHFLFHTALLYIMIRYFYDLSLFRAGNRTPWFADHTCLTGFYFDHNDFVGVFGYQINFPLFKPHISINDLKSFQ